MEMIPIMVRTMRHQKRSAPHISTAALTETFGTCQTDSSDSHLTMGYIPLHTAHDHRLTHVQPVTDANASPRLYDFIKQNKIKATHFMIGANILTAPAPFLTVFNDLQSWSYTPSPALVLSLLILVL